MFWSPRKICMPEEKGGLEGVPSEERPDEQCYTMLYWNSAEGRERVVYNLPILIIPPSQVPLWQIEKTKLHEAANAHAPCNSIAPRSGAPRRFSSRALSCATTIHQWHRPFRGSFSAASTPIFAIKYSFHLIDISEEFSRSTKWSTVYSWNWISKTIQKFSTCAKFDEHFSNILQKMTRKIHWNVANIPIWGATIENHLEFVDLDKSWKWNLMNILFAKIGTDAAENEPLKESSIMFEYPRKRNCMKPRMQTRPVTAARRATGLQGDLD